MSLFMGLAMSCVLTITGLLSAGQLTFEKFIVSFLIGFAISAVIGLIIPIKKISDGFVGKLKLSPGTIKARLAEALVSDVLLSPLMTFIMVFIAYQQATAHGARMPFGPMLLKAEIISFVVAFILSFIITPVITKLVLRINGITAEK